MKVKNNRLFPYPVLSVNHDDYLDNYFAAEDLSLEYDLLEATVKCKIVINDVLIKKLIEQGNISLCCHIECPTTKFRKVYKINYFDMEKCQINIPLKDICDSVEICFVLVANTDVTDYNNENLNERYKGINITLFKYRTVGYTDTEEFRITKQLDTNGEVPSIFDITNGEEETHITYDCDSTDKIIVFLPAEDYRIYEETKGSAIKRIKQMMTVVPVLAEILENIKNGGGEDYEGKGWYIVVENAISKMPEYSEGFQSENFKTLDSALLLAQRIFKEVSTDAFKEIDKLMEALNNGN